MADNTLAEQWLWNESLKTENGITIMKTKLLFFGGIIFLLLGWNTKDGILFFFFAIHLLTLAIGVVVSRYDQKRQPVLTLDSLTKADSSKS